MADPTPFPDDAPQDAAQRVTQAALRFRNVLAAVHGYEGADPPSDLADTVAKINEAESSSLALLSAPET